ncbi:IclR family transcriptional regulator [Salibacterium salarium]|uniref:IclR family transcriptional regulator n=1 Tax=Salibacterium salarium TaxID=284579 RepID=A0A428N1M8_9BACI|nr:helix-turn-helix domain-containing protein [Salibacterium salarium]RSL32333.1 IclR family transcriptional regulator [Salibacterium salarium]
MSEEKNKPQVQSLLVGFSVVELISKTSQPMKFNDIHHYTQITKSNLYKYLNTLTSLGILYRDPKTTLYSLGSTLIQYGMNALNKEDIINKLTPFLQQINLKTKETTLLSVWTQNGPMIAKMIHSNLGLNLGGQVGTFLPIHSAAGKLFAAFLNDPMSQAWKDTEQVNLTEEEIELLKEECLTITSQNISFAKESLAPSISSAAIPIFNYNDEISGSIIVVGFEKDIPNQVDQEISQYLLAKADEISKALGANNKM